MRIGIFIGPNNAPSDLDSHVRYVVDAENDGFDSFWFAQVAGADMLTVIALAGQKTRRIEMGTGVILTFPRHPQVLAQQALTAQAATGGRLTLGIGLSHKVSIEDRLGIPFDKPALHMREYLSVLRPLVDEGTVGFKGQVFRVNSALQVPNATPVPILIAALAPMMLRIAGELTEGTITWMAGRKTVETHIVPRINDAAAAAGRPEPRVCVSVPIAVTDDVEAGRERMAKDFARYDQLPSYRRMLDIEGVQGPTDVAVLGNEAEVERQLRALADSGATDLLANIVPVGEDTTSSVARTRALLKGLIGKI